MDMFNHYIFKDTFYIDEKKKIKEKQLENQKCRKNYDQLYQICKSELEEKAPNSLSIAGDTSLIKPFIYRGSKSMISHEENINHQIKSIEPCLSGK